MFDDLGDSLGPPDRDVLDHVMAQARHRRAVRRMVSGGVVAVVIVMGAVAAWAASSSPTHNIVTATIPSTAVPPSTVVPATSGTTTSTALSTTTMQPPSTTTSTTSATTTTSTTVPVTSPPHWIAQLHALFGANGAGRRTDMWEISPHVWTVTTTLIGAPTNTYSVGVTTVKGTNPFLNTICNFTGQGTIGCTATVNLDKYLPGGTPINVSVMAYDAASNGYRAMAQGDLKP